MGLPMSNIHLPTIVPASTESRAEHHSLQELIAAKDKIEGELSALGSVLDSVRTLPSMDVLMAASCDDEYQSDHFRRFSARRH